jgi:polyhydroxyalkanoate synthesis regulator phasin
MAESENFTLRLLQEMRGDIRGLDAKLDKNHAELVSQIRNLTEFISGESVLGRYAAASVEKRLESLEERVTSLEETR